MINYKLVFKIGLLVMTQFLATSNCLGQWELFRNAPPLFSGARYDNLAFSDSLHGSVVGPSGEIHTTMDGGFTWESTVNIPNYFRSICYQSRDTGFVGSLEGRLYKTTDGGLSWVNITSRIPAQAPVICGLMAYGDYVFGTGNFAAPAEFIKSADRGETWEYIALDSLLFGAVDVYFFDENVGIIGGIGLPKADGLGSLGTVIMTEDSGMSWRIIGESNIPNSYVWKFDVLSNGKIFGALQTFTGDIPAYIKADGLSEPFETFVIEDESGLAFDAQGIGFLNDDHGWLAGWGIGHFETLDGGETWHRQEGTSQINRLIRLDETTMLGAGSSVFAYSDMTASTSEDHIYNQEWPHTLHKVYPNPVADEMQVSLHLSAHTLVMIHVVTAQGQIVQQHMKQTLPSGQHEFRLDTSRLANGQYILVVRTYERHMSQPFQVQR